MPSLYPPVILLCGHSYDLPPVGSFRLAPGQYYRARCLQCNQFTLLRPDAYHHFLGSATSS